MKNTVQTIAFMMLFSGQIVNGYAGEPYVTNPQPKPMITWVAVGTYALADAGGAYKGFKWGRIGGTTGMALGTVVGGCVASGWLYMERHDNGIVRIDPPQNTETTGFTDEYEKAGYLHNQFLIDFINSSDEIYETPESYVNAVYMPLCQLMANEYHIDITLITQSISKESLINLIAPMSENTSISEHGRLISNEYGNTHLSSEYERIMYNLMPMTENGVDYCLAYINEEIQSINNKQLTAEEKEIMKYSCNILKYSFSLWSAN